MKKLSMSAKVIIAEIVFVGGGIIGVVLGILLYSLLKVPLFVCILAGAVVLIGEHIAAHFIGRCPYCHMSLHLVSGWLYDYCPFCGKHL